MLAEELKQRSKKLEKIKAEAAAEAEKLKGVSLTIAAKASANGAIFGSVTNIQIAESLEKQGITVDRKIISINAPVKQLGGYTATIKLHKEISVEVPFSVVAEAE